MRTASWIGLCWLVACGPAVDAQKDDDAPTDDVTDPAETDPATDVTDLTDDSDAPTDPTDAAPTDLTDDTDVAPTDTDASTDETDAATDDEGPDTDAPTDGEDSDVIIAPTDETTDDSDEEVDPTDAVTDSAAAADRDDDGHPAASDCDDADPDVHPGAADAPGDAIDQDCSGLPACFADADGDGWGTAAATVDAASCDADGASSQEGDCDDTNADINPDAGEPIADGVDQDCDGLERCFIDIDGDGIGRDDVDFTEDLSCTSRPFATQTGDCRDSDATMGPHLPEIPGDGIDGDCDGRELCWIDADHDGFGGELSEPQLDYSCPFEAGLSDQPGDCADDDQGTFPGSYDAPGTPGDEDCDGFEPCWEDADDDGYGGAEILDVAGCPNGIFTAGDCDDTDPAISRGATEIPADLVDSDCDGFELCFSDDDYDGFAAEGALILSYPVTCEGGATTYGDCAEGVPEVFPGAVEVPNDGVDQDCDGLDLCPEDLDDDGYASDTLVLGPVGCPDAPALTGDCDDDDDAIHPGQEELTNGLDDDCNPDTAEAGVARWTAANGEVVDVGEIWATGGVATFPTSGRLALGAGTWVGQVAVTGDLTVVGAGMGQTTWSAPATIVSATGDVTLQDVTFTGEAAVIAQFSHPLTLNRVELTGFSTAAITGAFTTVSATGLSIHDNTPADGVLYLWSSDVTFTDIDARDNASTTGSAVARFESSTIRWVGGNISDNEGKMSPLRVAHSDVFVNGSTFARNWGEVGGVFRVSSSNLQITDAWFDENHSWEGGAIDAYGGRVTLVGVTATANVADGDGGVVFATSAQVEITGESYLFENSATRGAVLCGPSMNVQIAEGTFKANSAITSGGVAFLAGGTLMSEGSTYVDNIAASGGAIAGANAALTFTDVTFARNDAPRGAAVSASASNNACALDLATCPALTFTRVTGTENTASNGGIVEVSAATVSGLRLLTDALTLTDNETDANGAVQLFADGSSVVDAYMTGGTLGPNTSQGELAPAVYLDATCTLEGRGVDFGPSDPDLVYDTRTFDVDTADVICELGWCITF